jgi:hypothetical protein
VTAEGSGVTAEGERSRMVMPGSFDSDTEMADVETEANQQETKKGWSSWFWGT